MDVLLARQLRERSAAADGVSAGGRSPARPLSSKLEPFEVFFDSAQPLYRLPADLEALYGPLGFQEPIVYSNFVASLDGVVTLGKTPSAGSVISGRNQPDRMLMGLLRACADAVLIGAGTLRETPGHHWTPEHIFPDLASSFADLRDSLGRKPSPRLVVLTARGEIPTSHPAITGGATIITTDRGMRSLERRLPASCDVIEVGSGDHVDIAGAVDELRARGHRVLLTEGGPHVMGELIARGLLDEAFLTVSPVVAGRDGERRLGMVAGMELLPERDVWTRLLSARRHGEFLFLRYGFRR